MEKSIFDVTNRAKGIHKPQSKSYLHTQKWNPSKNIFFNWPDPLYVAFVGKQSSIILRQVFVQHTRIVLRSHFVQIYLEKVKLVKIWISQKYSWKFQICFCFISFPPFNVQIWESIAFCWNWEQNLVENTYFISNSVFLNSQTLPNNIYWECKFCWQKLRQYFDGNKKRPTSLSYHKNSEFLLHYLYNSYLQG